MDRETLIDRIVGDGFYFIDFEASSLSPYSWPIEIGLAWIEGEDVVSEGRLIRPHRSWDMSDWSTESEAVHGISKSELTAKGHQAEEVARWFDQTVQGVGITDAPEFERRWLARLLSTAPPKHSITLMDFDQFIATMLPARSQHENVYASLDQHPVPHRAAEDAARLATAYLAGRSTDQQTR